MLRLKGDSIPDEKASVSGAYRQLLGLPLEVCSRGIRLAGCSFEGNPKPDNVPCRE